MATPLIPEEVKKAVLADGRNLFQRYSSRRLMVWLAVAVMAAVVLRTALKAAAWAVYNNQQTTKALELLLDFAQWFLGGFLVICVAYAGFRLAENLPWFKGTNGKTNGGGDPASQG